MTSPLLRRELGFENGYDDSTVVELRHDYLKSCAFRGEELPFTKVAEMLRRYLIKADSSIVLYKRDWLQLHELTTSSQVAGAKKSKAQARVARTSFISHT